MRHAHRMSHWRLRWRFIRAVSILTLAVVAVSVTLPFALHPSPERDVFHTQVKMGDVTCVSRRALHTLRTLRT